MAVIRLLPAALVLASLSADGTGRHSPAFALLLLAIPAACAAALHLYGDALAGHCGGLRPLLAGVAATLVVIAATLRSPAVVGGVPQLAVTLAASCLVLYIAIALEALRPLLVAQPPGRVAS